MAIRNMRIEGDDILRKKSRAVEKFGFVPCGDITLREGPEAGAPRIAFEKVLG